MKTHEKIKKGLEEEIPVHYHIDGEPRLTPRLLMDMQWLHKDALALIQQLEAENERLKYTLTGVMHFVDKWVNISPYDVEMDHHGDVAVNRAAMARKIALGAIEQLETERDAMKALFVDSNDLCVICKHQVYDDSVCSKVDYCCELCSPNCACHGCVEASHYEWRGVQKEK